MIARRRLIGLALFSVFGLALAYLARRWYRYEPPIEVPLAADFRLGYNLDYPGDWTNNPPFIDNFKNARGFSGACSEDDPDCHPTAHLDLDAEGWVKSLRYRDAAERAYDHIEVIISTSEDRSDIGKPFIVSWQGPGEIEVFGAPDATREPGRPRIGFSLPKGILVLRLKSVADAGGGYLKHIRVFRSDQEAALLAGEVFNPELIGFLQPFTSLRFMDWMQSNSPGRCSGGSKDGEACYAVSHEACSDGGRCVMPGKWSERPTLDQAIWYSAGQFLDNAEPGRGPKVGGYPVEVMVALANRAKASPHFNMPAHFEDEYVSKFAEYVKAELSPELPVSVEYSNEVWNWSFPQARYAKERGARLWPNDGTAWVQYMAARTHEMCRLFHAAFADQKPRLECLISPQTGWRELSRLVLDCPEWVSLHPEDESCVKYVDAINITGYFAGCLPTHPEVIRGWLRDVGRDAALTRGFQQLEHGGVIEGCEGEAVDHLDHTIETYRHFMQLAARRGLGLQVYESGTHFDYSAPEGSEQDEVKQFLVAMTQDPRMYDLYLRNISSFRETGGQSFNVWGWMATDDAWANASSPNDRQHPKYRAIADFSRSIAASGAPPSGAAAAH